MNKNNTFSEQSSSSSSMKIGALLMLLLMINFPLSAQKLTVESMEYIPNDASAASYETQMEYDAGLFAGIVKVYVALDGVEFEGGGVLKQEKRGMGEYWVWMAKDSSRLKVRAQGFLPLEVNFRTYEGVNVVHAKSTYKLVLTLPAGGQAQQDDGMRYLAMTVEPKNASVSVDGILQSVENGEVVVSLPMGSHRYQVQAPGYASQEGTVEVGDAGKQLSVRLVSTQATLRVECVTSGAQIYVNGQHRGALPWSSSLTPGNYKVEVRLEGYRSQQQSVTLKDGESRTLSIPALEMITGSLSVSCRPIGSEVYVDGQKVGATPNIFRNIPIGQRRVEVQKEGFTTLTQTVTIEENKQSELSGSLTAVAAQQAVSDKDIEEVESALKALVELSAAFSTNGNNASVSAQGTGGTSGNRTFTVNGVSFNMVRVEGGTFQMGASDEQKDSWDPAMPVHQVTLSTYYIGETEVTQSLWEAVMGSNPSKFKGTQQPVERVSWGDCQTFISKLNSLTGQQFKLPTEAEWEFAARGGNKSEHYKYSGSNTIDKVAWYGKSKSKTHEVSTKQANELGIYDMSGNVCEWCKDWNDEYSAEAQTDPIGPSTGSQRVFRGGSCAESEKPCRVEERFPYHLLISEDPINLKSPYIGLRLAL